MTEITILLRDGDGKPTIVLVDDRVFLRADTIEHQLGELAATIARLKANKEENTVPRIFL